MKALFIISLFLMGCSSQPKMLFIYYANETFLSSEARENYSVFTSWMATRPENKSAVKISKQIWSDATVFPKAVDEEISIIKDATLHENRVNVAIFTNAMAFNGKFLIGRERKIYEKSFRYPQASHFITRSQPLNQPEVLKSALLAVVNEFPPSEYHYSMVTKSHGNPDRAMVTRVTLDHHEWDSKSFFDYLDGKIEKPKNIQRENGTSQKEYFDIIREIGDLGARFRVIFLEACKVQKGILGKIELPSNVGLVYSPAKKTDYKSVDYSFVFRSMQTGIEFHTAFSSALDDSMGKGKAKRIVRSATNVWLYFIPLILFSVFMLVKAIRKRSKNTA